MKIDREEIIWAAGFFDGEGYVGKKDLSKSYTTQVRLKTSSADKDMIERFHKAVLFLGHFRGPLEQKGIGKKPIYEWHTGKFEHVQAVIALLFPFMCSRRRKDMKDCLKSASLRKPPHRPFKKYCKRSHLMKETRIYNKTGKPLGCGLCSKIRNKNRYSKT